MKTTLSGVACPCSCGLIIFAGLCKGVLLIPSAIRISLTPGVFSGVMVTCGVVLTTGDVCTLLAPDGDKSSGPPTSFLVSVDGWG